MKSNILFLSICSVFMTGCLATRDQLREVDSKRDSQQQVVAMQQAHYQDLDSDMRAMNGRLAALENQLNMTQSEKRSLETQGANERAQFESRLKVYEDALTKMEQQYLALSQKLEALQANDHESGPQQAATVSKGKSKLGTFDQGEEDLKKKNFRQAIVNYQKYRESNPKGKNYPEATYKMGVSFQELGMKDEAAPFFNEVVEKFPKSKTADKAKIRLRQLK